MQPARPGAPLPSPSRAKVAEPWPGRRRQAVNTELRQVQVQRLWGQAKRRAQGPPSIFPTPTAARSPRNLLLRPRPRPHDVWAALRAPVVLCWGCTEAFPRGAPCLRGDSHRAAATAPPQSYGRPTPTCPTAHDGAAPGPSYSHFAGEMGEESTCPRASADRAGGSGPVLSARAGCPVADRTQKN